MINFYNYLTDKKVSQSLYEMLFDKFMQNPEPPTYREYTGTLPVTITANGSDLTDWVIYGNTGGLGDRTANLSSINEVNDSVTNAYFKSNKLTDDVLTAGEYTISFNIAEKTAGHLSGSIGLGTSTDYNYDLIGFQTPDNVPYSRTVTFTITQSQIDTYGGYVWARFVRAQVKSDFSYKVTDIMLNSGSTSLPYEPYGYKITILSNSEPTDIYIDAPLGVNETVSFADTNVHIPTNNGSTVISCDNTVQPEKMYIKYIGG